MSNRAGPSDAPARLADLASASVPLVLLCFLVIVLVALFAAPPVRSNVLVVDPLNGPYSTIRGAIDAAAPQDTIEIAPGSYPESLAITIPLTLRGRDGAAATILDGEGAHRIVDAGAVSLAIQGLAFHNGSAALGGAALRQEGGSLSVQGCAFRDNEATVDCDDPTLGGAVQCVGEMTARFADCLFARNRLSGAGTGFGGAVGASGDWTAEKDSRVTAGGLEFYQIEFDRCSFLGNEAQSGYAISSDVPVAMRNCLFADGPGSGKFVLVAEGSLSSCNLFWRGLSPQVEETWEKQGADVVADPRICPGDPESVHESSPAWTDQICGPIGSLPVGCAGPIAIAMRPLRVEPAPDQAIRLYGYGLEEALDASLEGPGGESIASAPLALEGTWLTARFDLSGAADGDWTLVVRTATSGDLRVEGIRVSPASIVGFFDGWVGEPGPYEGAIAGRALPAQIELALRSEADESVVLPVEILRRAGAETLHVRVDLGSAPSGPYDLEAALPGGDTISVRPALFLGAPEVIRVPEDQPSIFEAIDAAPPCAEIQVAERAWVGNLVLDKPLRLRGVPNGYLLPVVRPSVPLSPVVRILEEAGPLAVVESLQISDGMAGGILCEAPAMLRGNRVVDNDGPKGAGIYAASGGARILGNLVFNNDAGEGGEPANLWSTDPGITGVAGGLFCLDCWLEGNDIAHNSAQSCAGLVADGVIRGNRVQENWPGFAWLGRWRMGAVRGEVTGNRFDNCCGSDTPYLFAEGPTRIENNDFTDVSGMMCAMPENVHLKGSFDLIGNRFLGAGLQACLAVDGVREANAGHFRMVGNAFASDMPIHLYLDPSEGICVKGYGDEPWAAIPEDSLLFRCNATESESFRLYLHRAGGDVTECDSCLYVPGDSEPDPPGCPETFPDIEDICEFSPVLVQDARVEGTPEGVRLLWSMPGDVDPEGFDVQRASGGTSVRLNAERLPACERCEFLDTAPPRGVVSVYTLLVHLAGETQPVEARLGEWSGEPVLVRPGLELPAPHPVRGRATIRFTVPAAEAASEVRLDLLDLQGRLIATLRNERFEPGRHDFLWEARDGEGRPLAAGLYALRLTTPSGAWVRKVLVTR